MNWRQRLIQMGVYDRLVSIYSNPRNRDGSPLRGQVPTDHYPSFQKTLRYYQSLNLGSRYARDAFMALEEEARKAVNAARRWSDQPADRPSNPASRLPCPENPGGRCADRIEYTGWVVVTDPASGVTTRVPFVHTSDRPLSRNELAAAAWPAVSAAVGNGDYDRGGRVSPQTMQQGELIVASISGRG